MINKNDDGIEKKILGERCISLFSTKTISSLSDNGTFC